MAELELSILSRQCMKHRIPDEQTLLHEVWAWVDDRNSKVVKVDWQFFTPDACIKFLVSIS
jgi:hypothetical protein